MSVRKNVESKLEMCCTDKSKRERATRTSLRLACLLSFENYYPDQLSGGMKQRVSIVRARD